MRVENFENNTQLRAYFSATNIYYIYIFIYSYFYLKSTFTLPVPVGWFGSLYRFGYHPISNSH